ncbi:MAG: NAD(P)H-dependent oxidoreductase subunit E [Chloroflexi bacterium]|nr:NAD(P)H-dependent oxidoreductase subunit E [Chloroflexota bacterium]
MTKVLPDPAKRAMLLTALYIAQEQYGSLTPDALERVSARLGISPAQVYETATFYSMFRTQPAGRYVLQVCEGLSCYLADGAENLAAYIQNKLHICPGETTTDGLFTLQMVQCLASCSSSPAMRVNDTLYENLTADRVDMLLDELRGG